MVVNDINYKDRLVQLQQQITFLSQEKFVPATSGTRFKVFLSENFVVRFRDNDPNLLNREIALLTKLDHPLIPKIAWHGEIANHSVMVENRLYGQGLDVVWRSMDNLAKKHIVEHIAEFLSWLRTNKGIIFTSVNSGKSTNNFYDLIFGDLNQKIDEISHNLQATKLVREIAATINAVDKSIFASEPSLVHGDMIIHNLLTDMKNLTGVLDWEFSLYGDPDYDLARIYYYHECAKAYAESDDETFEYDFTSRLIEHLEISALIPDQNIFKNKYKIFRAYFFLNALAWAVNSKNPEKNIEELYHRW